MQAALVNYFQAVPLLKENKKDYGFVQFIGENNHFIAEMKAGPSETLK